MTLTNNLTFWRADRPDEWVMDEFIRKAALLETALLVLTKESFGWPLNVNDPGDVQVILQLINEIEEENKL
jgi:hypothetical protein